MIGAYGPVIFGTVGGAVCTFDGMKKTVSARWGVHEVFGDKPMLEYSGPQLIEVEFDMNLIVPFTVNPRATITLLQEFMDLAIPNPLVIGSMPMGRDASLFIMTSLEVSPEYFFRGGSIIGAKVRVSLKEYPTNFVSNLLKALKGAILGDVKAPTDPSALNTEAANNAPIVLDNDYGGYSESFAKAFPATGPKLGEGGGGTGGGGSGEF